MDTTRREMILGAGGMLVLSKIAHAGIVPNVFGSSMTIPLWPDQPPGGGGPNGSLHINAQGAISNIATPALEVYRPRHPNGMAVLVAAGGGYKRIEVESEARAAAHWLTAHGIAAFVLRYRLPGEGWHAGPLAPLQDAQRAMRVIAGLASRLGINPGQIGVLGFSAGGHLMGLIATRSEFASYHPIDGLDATSAHPDQAALIYPIVTLLPPYDHTSTRTELVGNHPTMAQSAEWSVQTHVREHCPRLFLVQAQDDPISNIANTAILEKAAQQADIPVEWHVLSSGGHGFRMGQPGTPSGEWPKWYQAWLGLGKG